MLFDSGLGHQPIFFNPRHKLEKSTNNSDLTRLAAVVAPLPALRFVAFSRRFCDALRRSYAGLYAGIGGEMASFRKIDGRWRAEICVAGKRKSKRFDTKRAAQAWAVDAEREIAAPEMAGHDKTLGDMLLRYAAEVSPTKRGARHERQMISRLCADIVAAIPIRELSPADLALWRDRRLLRVSGSTVQREMNLLSNAFTVARREWLWLASSPLSDVRRPKHNPPRQRLPTRAEMDAIYYVLGYSPGGALGTKSARVGWAFAFALETAMRAGEIVAMRWGDIRGRHVHIPKTKNGHARDVPLSVAAAGLLEAMRGAGLDADTVLGLSSASLDALWRKARLAAGVDDLHFHDSRRAALTRLAEKLTVLELARMSGHRDLRILQSVYYAPDPDDLAMKLG